MTRRRQSIGSMVFGQGSLAEAYDGLRADYNAAKNSRFRKRLTGVRADGSSADYHYRTEADYLRIMELARSMDRNDIVVGQGIDRVCDNIMQGGFAFDAQTGDADLNTEIAGRWKAWSEDPEQCSKSGEFDLHELARMSLRHMIVDGDICHLPLADGSMEQMEGHRLRTPPRTKRKVAHGILLDSNRRHLEYWFTKDDIGTGFDAGLRVSKDIRRVLARDDNGRRNVFFVRNPKRVTQTRGVTCLAPAVDFVGMHDDLQFAQLVKAQVSACFGIIENVPEESANPNVTPLGEQEDETLDDGTTATIEGIAPGTRFVSAPGHKLEGFSPNIPNQEFFPHTMLVLTFIAVNLGVPVHVLLLDPSKTNFSGWRGAIQQARTGFRRQQTLIRKRFYQPVHEWKIWQWLANDRELRRDAGYTVDSNGALVKTGARDINVFGHRFNAPAWEYIEPNKDATAANTTISGGLNSRRNVLAVQGLDIEDVDDQHIADTGRLVRQAMKEADAIRTEFPNETVHYAQLLYGFNPKQLVELHRLDREARSQNVQNQ